MPARVIGVGVGTYLDPNGTWRFGLHGETVEVAESDLDRFDRLNRPTAADDPAELKAEQEPAEPKAEAKPATRKR